MIEQGTQVTWNNGQECGRVTDVFNRKTTWRLQGSQVELKERKDGIVYLIERESGESILKAASEVRRIS